MSARSEASSNLVFSRKTVFLIIFALGTPALAAAVELVIGHWDDSALAEGPIVPLGAIWYVISNLLCANAVYLYCRGHIPKAILIACWIGLAGGGSDHIVETWQWYHGTHEPFAEHWNYTTLAGMSVSWFPFVAFGVTSVVGIWGTVYVFLRYQKDVSVPTKVFIAVWALVAGLWGLVGEPNTPHSTVVWHVGHIFVTHLFLSMLPPIIVWTFAPHINLFSIFPQQSDAPAASTAEKAEA